MAVEVIFPWWVFALVMSWSMAAQILLNEWKKLPAEGLVMWRAMAAAVLTCPLAFSVPIPTQWIFYVCILINGSIVYYTDRVIFRCAADYGAGVVLRLSSLFIISGFLVWFLFEPSLLVSYVQSPYQSLVIIFCIFSVAVLGFYMNKCPLNKGAFQALLPAFILVGFVTAFNKTAMDSGGLPSGPFWYQFLMACYVSFLSGIRFLSMRDRASAKKAFLKSGMTSIACISAVLITVYGLAKGYAFASVEHPAYASAIERTAPFWIMVFYILVGYREKAKTFHASVIVLLVIILIFATM